MFYAATDILFFSACVSSYKESGRSDAQDRLSGEEAFWRKSYQSVPERSA